MLVKLLPSDVTKHWDSIREAMEETIPQEYLRTHDRLNNILDNLLLDSMQAWFVVVGVDLLPKVVALLITTIFNDNCVRADVLRLYCLYGYEPIPEQEWDSSFETLTKFAIGRGCVQMEAFTGNVLLIERAKKHGWDTRMTHIYRELPKEIS